MRSRGSLFAITRGPSMCQLLFDSTNCYSLWRGEPVKVTLSFPSHPDRAIDSSLSATSTTLALGCDLHPLVTYSTVSIGDTILSLEVAFTSLPTNIFHALAHAGLVQCTPSSAQESDVPQARTALRAFEQSLKTGTSFNVIFQAYTRRISPGKVARPIPIYANTTVLQATTLLPDFSAEEDLYFSSLFELPEGDTPPLTSPESYEYESDSDLDDDERDNLATMKPVEELTTDGEASACHEQQSHTPAHVAQPHEDTTDNRSLSSFSSFEAGFQEQPNNRMALLEEAETVLIENMKSSFRVILVKGVAWKTWHAFVYYCYTGTVNFSSLRSQATTEATLQQSPSKDDPPRCSPKSMYQLARKLRNDSLAQLAFKAIETRLSAANILDEALSKFTARKVLINLSSLWLLLTPA
ncbi:hypothetical protein K503DRAFT_869896 [Rhizopogon vinicolor AM-OR11-026]|uniref:BTB domain-containing protein n=1 Tax=Rhizopogon vinicolor AM-OR11-026 TaxID=1314800 RepID=A0A1B7MJW9_9AGAM|nr:hypothetical protein K503DRAFT_869896 [Rhizopogon vinicolor AM-OR11-026]